MNDIDFLIPSQMQVGHGAFGDGFVVNVGTDLVDAGLTIVLSVQSRGIVRILASADSVRPMESVVWAKLDELGRIAGKKLDAELVQKKLLTGQ
jgi:hypothetical protein